MYSTAQIFCFNFLYACPQMGYIIGSPTAGLWTAFTSCSLNQSLSNFHQIWWLFMGIISKVKFDNPSFVLAPKSYHYCIVRVSVSFNTRYFPSPQSHRWEGTCLYMHLPDQYLQNYVEHPSPVAKLLVFLGDWDMLISLGKDFKQLFWYAIFKHKRS